jgi:hypothetical protein
VDVVVVSLTRSSFLLPLWVWVFYLIFLGRDNVRLYGIAGGVPVSIEG